MSEDPFMGCAPLPASARTPDPMMINVGGLAGRKSDDPVRWVSAKEAAEHLGLAVETVYELVKKREIPGHKLGGMWRFSIQELDAHLLRS